jgi:hypothetical protein
MAEGEVDRPDEILEDQDVEDIIESKDPLTEETGNKGFRLSKDIGTIHERQIRGAYGSNEEE